MTTLFKGKNFRIKSSRRISILGYEGYYSRKGILLITDPKERKHTISLRVDVYKEIMSIIKDDIKNGHENDIDNILISSCEAIILLLRNLKLKTTTLKKIIEDHEEDNESAVKINNISFDDKNLSLIVKNHKNGEGIIATRDANNNII